VLVLLRRWWVLETANATLVEIDARLQRLDAMCQMLVVDLDSRDISHETTEDLEVQRVPFRLAASQFCFPRGQRLRLPRLSVQRLDDCLWIEQTEQPPDAVQESALGGVECGLGDRIIAFRL